MKNLVYSLNQYDKFLRKMIAKTEQSLDDLPEGHLKISHSRGQTFYCMRGPESNKFIYIPRKNADFAALLAQKDYNRKLLKHMKNELLAIESMLADFPEKNIDVLFNSLHPDRRKLVRPVMLTAGQYAEKWQGAPYTGKEFSDNDTSSFYTDKGERVRSKSEVIIANILNKFGLPYKYECPLNLKGVTVHPDFTILDLRNRREVYLEHFGMMDNQSYSQSFVRRINLYEQNGIFPGRELLFTVESSANPLNTRILQAVIKAFFFDAQSNLNLFDL